MHRVLIVDPQEESRFALAGTFSEAGWDVVAVPGVEDGICRMDTDPEPCCIVVDCKLVDGKGVLRRRLDKRMQSLAVVFTDRAIPPEIVQLACGLGADAFVVNPFGVEDVWRGHCRVCSAERR